MQEYWSGLTALLQGLFPTQGSNPCLITSPALQVCSLPLAPPGKPWYWEPTRCRQCARCCRRNWARCKQRQRSKPARANKNGNTRASDCKVPLQRVGEERDESTLWTGLWSSIAGAFFWVSNLTYISNYKCGSHPKGVGGRRNRNKDIHSSSSSTLPLNVRCSYELTVRSLHKSVGVAN